MVVETSRPSVPLLNSSKWDSEMPVQRSRAHFALRHISAELLAPRLHVLDFGAVVSGPVKRRLCSSSSGIGMPKRERNISQFVFVQLLLLVSDVLAFTRLAQSVAFDGLREDDAWALQCDQRQLDKRRAP